MIHHKNRLTETVLIRGHNVSFHWKVRGHNIHFHWKVRKLIFSYPQYPFLPGALALTSLQCTLLSTYCSDMPFLYYGEQKWERNTKLKTRSPIEDFNERLWWLFTRYFHILYYNSIYKTSPILFKCLVILAFCHLSFFLSIYMFFPVLFNSLKTYDLILTENTWTVAFIFINYIIPLTQCFR